MKVLLIGVGGVGEAIAVIAKDRPGWRRWCWPTTTSSAPRKCSGKLGQRRDSSRSSRWTPRDKKQIVALARKHEVDLIMNAVDPVFNEKIFDAAYQAGCDYMDMAMTLSAPHPTDPYRKCGVKLGDYQFERAAKWEKKGLLALVGMGVEPGMADVFARYAEKHLFDEIDEIGVRDGANLEVRGYEFAPNFSIWTTIEECLNPPVIWEKDKGWFTTEPFSEPEVFDFPGGHRPGGVRERRARGSAAGPALGQVQAGDLQVRPGRRVHRRAQDASRCWAWTTRTRSTSRASRWRRATWWRPACPTRPTWATRCSARRAPGTWVKGAKDGKPRQVYLYQVADNETCMKKYGVQAVVWQTAVSPVIAMELLATGAWQGKGVLGPEAFDPDPFMALMAKYDFPFGVREM